MNSLIAKIKKQFSLKQHPFTFLLAFMLLFLVIMGFLNRFFFAPKILLLLFVILLSMLLGKLDLFYKDWFVFLSFIYLFDTVRGIIYILTCKLNLPVHTLYTIRFDRLIFGEVPSVIFQKNFLNPEHFSWFEKFLTIIHGTHFIAFILVGFYIWFYKRHSFQRFKNSFYYLTFLGISGYAIIPTVPPWMASQYLGVLPTLTRFNAEIYNMTIPDITSGFNTNPIGAMPSLHTAFPVLCAFILWRLFKWKSLPFVGYTLLMLFTIIYTGDHYIIDILAGSGLAFTCYLFAFRKKNEPQNKPVHSGSIPNEKSSSKNSLKILLIGSILLVVGISIGLYNKHQFMTYPEQYDFEYAPKYADFFKNPDTYKNNYKIQLYFGSYYFHKKDYQKALLHFHQAGKVAQGHIEKSLTRYKILQTKNVIDNLK